MLISDPQAVKSAAAMAVGTGCMEDGKIPGLAHFVEHLLFIGSEKYPEKDYFMGKLMENGGKTNAFTAYEETVFFFNVKNDAFETILDVFSGFFTSPEFPEARVRDEIKAVNSEHQQSIFIDGWRLRRVLGLLSNPHHPFSDFHTGSLETLGDVTNLHKVAQEFWNLHYVAGNMKLALYGNHSISEMEKWTKRMFSAVPKGQKEPIPSISIYNSTGNFAVFKTISPGHSLLLTWDLSSQFSNIDSQYTDFLGYLLQNYGLNGLRQSLMNDGLVLNLAAGLVESLQDGCLFYVELTLSQGGFTHWEMAVSQVLGYLEGLKNAENPDFESAWTRFKSEKVTDFDYIDDFPAIEMVLKVARNMHHFPPKQYLGGFNIQDSVDISGLKQELDTMTLSNCVGLFMSSDWKPGDFLLGKELKFQQIEHFYEIPYEILAFPEIKSSAISPHFPGNLLDDSEEIGLKECPDCPSEAIELTSTPSTWFYVTLT